MLRSDFDLQALYAALDEQRRASGMSWEAVAREINAQVRDVPGHRPIAKSTITRLDLAEGGLTGFPIVMRITGWLDEPAAVFTRASGR